MKHTMPIGLRFSLLHRAFMKQLDARLQEKGLTGVQFGVLSQLRRLQCGGQRERLEKQGFVVCAPSERDRRFKSIRPTDRAAALQREMDELDESIFRELCRGLTAEEVDALRALTDKLLDNIFSRCCQKEGGEDAGD